ncbi:MAG: hypothetical protein KIT79_12645 [Deltaproteobacteria bacterium]|nr:hypothetical protein [Deltaproteobacteria bacterium]
MVMDATHQPLLREDITAAAALEAHRFVGADGNYATATNPAKGVTERRYNSGDTFASIVIGTAVVELAEAVLGGQNLGPGASGKAVKCGPSGTAAIALAAGSAGDTIPVLLVQHRKTVTIVHLNLGTVTANTTKKGPYLPANAELVGAYVESADGRTQSDTDYLVIELKNGSTVLADFDTRTTDGDGALTADVAAAMIMASRAAGGGRLDAVVTKGGTVSNSDFKITALIAL